MKWHQHVQFIRSSSSSCPSLFLFLLSTVRGPSHIMFTGTRAFNVVDCIILMSLYPFQKVYVRMISNIIRTVWVCGECLWWGEVRERARCGSA